MYNNIKLSIGIETGAIIFYVVHDSDKLLLCLIFFRFCTNNPMIVKLIATEDIIIKRIKKPIATNTSPYVSNPLEFISLLCKHIVPEEFCFILMLDAIILLMVLT